MALHFAISVFAITEQFYTTPLSPGHRGTIRYEHLRRYFYKFLGHPVSEASNAENKIISDLILKL